MVRKFLRYLLERFKAKVTTIEESKAVDSLKIDEFVDSLQTFDMTFESPRKGNGVALNAIKKESQSFKSEEDEKKSNGELQDLLENLRNI